MKTKRIFLFALAVFFLLGASLQAEDREITLYARAEEDGGVSKRGPMAVLKNAGLDPNLYTELRHGSPDGPRLSCENPATFEIRRLKSRIYWLPDGAKVDQKRLARCLAVENQLFGKGKEKVATPTSDPKPTTEVAKPLVSTTVTAPKPKAESASKNNKLAASAQIPTPASASVPTPASTPAPTSTSTPTVPGSASADSAEKAKEGEQDPVADAYASRLLPKTAPEMGDVFIPPPPPEDRKGDPAPEKLFVFLAVALVAVIFVCIIWVALSSQDGEERPPKIVPASSSFSEEEIAYMKMSPEELFLATVIKAVKENSLASALLAQNLREDADGRFMAFDQRVTSKRQLRPILKCLESAGLAHYVEEVPGTTSLVAYKIYFGHRKKRRLQVVS